MWYTIQVGLDNLNQVDELFEIDNIYFQDAEDFSRNLAYGLLEKMPNSIFIVKDYKNEILGYMHYIFISELEYKKFIDVSKIRDCELDISNVLCGNGNTGYIYFMVICVKPDYTNQGIGRALLECYEKSLIELRKNNTILGEFSLVLTESGYRVLSDIGFVTHLDNNEIKIMLR